jgi:drug/metabolite transporter (DMT)-like permease
MGVAGSILFTTAALQQVGIQYTTAGNVRSITRQVWGQRCTPSTDAALILSLESIFAVLSGWLFLSETLTGIQISSCALILGGVLLTQLQCKISE